MKPLRDLGTYFQGVQTEIRKVVWPSFPVLLRYFVSVLLGLILATAFIYAVDYVFIHLLGLVINK